MSYGFTLTTTLPASAQEIYDAWLSSEGHTAMTGGLAHIDPAIGGAFDAWDGFITGKTLELDPGRRIKQSWRTLYFSSNDADSNIELILIPAGDSTKLQLKHTNLPEGQTSYEVSGWQQYYFEPMFRRFEWLRLKTSMLAR